MRDTSAGCRSSRSSFGFHPSMSSSGARSNGSARPPRSSSSPRERRSCSKGGPPSRFLYLVRTGGVELLDDEVVIDLLEEGEMILRSRSRTVTGRFFPMGIRRDPPSAATTRRQRRDSGSERRAGGLPSELQDSWPHEGTCRSSMEVWTRTDQRRRHDPKRWLRASAAEGRRVHPERRYAGDRRSRGSHIGRSAFGVVASPKVAIRRAGESC